MDAEPGAGRAPEGAESTAAMLKAYVDANADKFTDEAITAELTRAGYAPEEVRAALAEAARSAVAPPRRRAVVTILIAYAATFAILSLGMLANAGRSSGLYLPNAAGGILVLAASLGFALALSLAWVGSRRAAALLFAVLLGLYGVGLLGTGGFGGFIVIGMAVALAVLALRSSRTPSRRATATLGMLLAVPIVLLVIVAGLCVATGLPIPRTG